MKYPLEVVSVGEDVYCVMSKGHHDPALFMEACKREFPSWSMGKPEHLWKRTIPANDSDYSFWYIDAEPGSRGAFPVTWSVEDYSSIDTLCAPCANGNEEDA